MCESINSVIKGHHKQCAEVNESGITTSLHQLAQPSMCCLSSYTLPRLTVINCLDWQVLPVRQMTKMEGASAKKQNGGGRRQQVSKETSDQTQVTLPEVGFHCLLLVNSTGFIQGFHGH